MNEHYGSYIQLNGNKKILLYHFMCLQFQLKSDWIFVLFETKRIIVTDRFVNTEFIQSTAFFINFCCSF